MRLSRTSLLSRLTSPDVPPVVLLEAPPGYGKSWLARRALDGDVLRLRGELGPLADGRLPPAHVLLDDAHLLTRAHVDILLEHIEEADGPARLLISGRLVADAIHEVTQLVDGLIVDAEALSISAAEIREVLPPGSATLANRLAEASDGCVRTIATSLEQAERDPSSDAVAIASRMVRAAGEAALHQLDVHPRSVVALLARAPGIDRVMLDRLGGPSFVDDAVAAGVPLRRQITGALEVSNAATLRGLPIEPGVAGTLADDMMQRGRVLEAVSLMIDAGGHQRAMLMLKSLNESVVETVEPRPMLSLLARLGSTVERDPELLLLRSGAHRSIGRLDESIADIDRAVERSFAAAPQVQRRVAIESARARLVEGKTELAEQIIHTTLSELGEGEGRTFARAHQALAECAIDVATRDSLQQAAESLLVATSAWEASSEFALARGCRTLLALGVLSPLGRFDEALAQTGQLLGAPDLSDAERSYTFVFEGFILNNANRVEAAELRFERTADLGYLHDNPRLVALAAWGMALVASRRMDMPATLRWIHTAEHTALSKADDVLGVQFLCDVVDMLGALGDLDGARRYLALAFERDSMYSGQVLYTKFVLDARQGILGDVDEALSKAPPMVWWRVKLVAAYAMAANGDVDGATAMRDDARRELLSLGFVDFESLGEIRIAAELDAILQRTTMTASTSADAPTPSLAVAAAPQGTRVTVMGGPIAVHAGGEELAVPAGNPQRLVGVIVANGGSVSIDQASEALWGDDDVERSRTRLRNVLLRLRRVVGDVVVRTGNGLRLGPDVSCDLYDFRRQAEDALSTARADPELAGELAARAVGDRDVPVFVDFEYDDWAVAARRRVDQQRISLLDLLSVQAEDNGDLAAAQALAERALRLDKYTDSRYVRLAELLTMQDRMAAAMAVLEDAAAVAREIGDGTSDAAKVRREELMRRAASGS
jgi:DNA-binding SARP family transcriptional activator/tetratricopeptide (TPR) repeat protein